METIYRAYAGYADLPEDELNHLVMMGDDIAHAQHDYNRMCDNAIEEGEEYEIVIVSVEEVEIEREELRNNGVIY